MEHQDWKPVTIGNPKLKNVNNPPKIITHKPIIDLHKIKIENEQENFVIKKIPKNIVNQIISSRNVKKITQKDMDIKLNIQKNIYNDIETGKSLYNQQTKEIIQKIQKCLGVKFNK